VLLGEMLPPVVAALPAEKCLLSLQQQAEKICGKKREQACVVAAGSRYNELILRLGAWLWRTPWRTTTVAAELDMPVPVFAAQMLDRRYRQACRCGRQFKTLTAEQRHALRIAAKKLRYTAEFFSGIYPRKVTRRYIQALSHLQDELGILNDQVVAEHLLTEIVGDDQLRERASGVITGWYICQTDHHVAALAQAWKRFGRCDIFWKNE
jgi:triphosphatase